MVPLVYRLKGSGILRFPFLSPCFHGMINKTMSSSSKSSSSFDDSAPWLMLPPPAFKAGGNVNFDFYNLAEDRVLSFRVDLPDDNKDTVLVGSSHGWLTFFNHRHNHLFLSNPLSGRYVKLPSILTLPNPEFNLRDGCGTVSKVILSCSPDDDEEGKECRAMMSFGPGDRLAFCLPSRSPAHWTPIGKLFFDNYTNDDSEEEENGLSYSYGRAYEDFVYCSRRKLFSCITEFVLDLEPLKPGYPTELEDWDLGEPGSPSSRVCYRMSLLKFESENCSWLKENQKLLEKCIQAPYLVFAEESGQLFIVTRFINVDPYKTVGFSVLKVDQKYALVDNLRLADDSVEEGGGGPLDGLAMFVGLNHSFAVSAAAESGLKPNSIYFTDVSTSITHPSNVRNRQSRGLDNGIFDYANKTISAFPYDICPLHDDRTLSTPVWFTPSG